MKAQECECQLYVILRGGAAQVQVITEDLPSPHIYCTARTLAALVLYPLQQTFSSFHLLIHSSFSLSIILQSIFSSLHSFP